MHADAPLLSSQTLILAGVVLHIVGSVVRHFVQSQTQRDRIQAIENKLDDILGQLRREE